MKNQAYRMAMLYDFYGDLLTPRQKEFYDLYYNDDLSLAEIAENEGITRQGVRDSIKRAESQLLEMEERLGLARRFREMREGLDSIRDAAREIQELNSRFGYSREIQERAERIEKLSQKMAEDS